jgi:hypothetical protein
LLPLIGFWSGLERAGARKRMLVLYWFVHTLCALIAALPASAAAVAPLARSTMADELLRQFDFAWLAEWFANGGESALPALAAAALMAAALLWLASVGLAGGAVALIADADSPYAPALFWQNAGRNFWRFLRLSLYFLLIYAVVYAASGLIVRVADAIWGEGLAAAPVVRARQVRLGLLIVLFGIISTASDFAKVRLVLADSRQSLRACLGSLRLAARNPGVIFWLWACFAAAAAAAAWVYVESANRLESARGAGFAVLVLVQQAYVLLRIYLRFAAWGAAAELDPLLRPLPAAEPESAPVQAGTAGPELPDYEI